MEEGPEGGGRGRERQGPGAGDIWRRAGQGPRAAGDVQRDIRVTVLAGSWEEPGWCPGPSGASVNLNLQLSPSPGSQTPRRSLLRSL